MPRRARALALILALAGVQGSASADDDAPPRRPDGPVGAVGRTQASAMLVGPAGELLVREEDGRWRRRGLGGVGPRVTSAAGAPGDLWATCEAGPPFHHDGTTWSAAPIPGVRGLRGVVSVSGVPAVALRREIYVRASGHWQKVAHPGAPVASLWAGGPADVLVLARGELFRCATGGACKLVRLPLRRRESVRALFGLRDAALALGAEGSLALVRGGRPATLSLDRAVKDLAIQAVGDDRGGALIVGRARIDGGSATALLRLRGRKVGLEDLVPLERSETADAVLALEDGGVLVVTSQGRVLSRTEAGAWAEQEVDLAPPVATRARAPNPPARYGPLER